MPLHKIEETLRDRQEALLAHPLYPQLSDETALLRFMECHVFAVWDFMCLVKALQRRLTCVEVPWLPSANPVERRFINEIVLDEESDLDAQGRPRSHFEMYVEAMAAAGADTEPILRFVRALRDGAAVDRALDATEMPAQVRAFVETTLSFARGDTLELASAFAYGRETVIPPMFCEVVAKLNERAPERFGPFAFYLNRHIETDGETHGPIARQLVERLVADDPDRRTRAIAAAERALEARVALWDATSDAIRRSRAEA